MHLLHEYIGLSNIPIFSYSKQYRDIPISYLYLQTLSLIIKTKSELHSKHSYLFVNSF